MRHRSSLLISGLVGIALAVLVTVVTGWLAALPTPSAVLRGFNHRSVILFTFTSVVFIDIPVMLLSYAVGLVLFRALRKATPVLVLICAAPWVLYCGYDMIHAFSDMARSTRMGLLFSLYTWSSLFTVPVGLFVASLSRGGWPSNNRLERSRVASSLGQGENR
jgi:hypothetical protein